MKHYEGLDMVQKVHKNVRYMLSQAREILKTKQKLPPLVKGSPNYLEDASLSNIDCFQSKCVTQQDQSMERFRRFNSKIRPFSLVLSQSKSSTRSIKSSDKKEKDQRWEEAPQPLFSSFLNKAEKQLIDNPRIKTRKKRHNKSENTTILPTICKDRGRMMTQNPSKYCMAISINALQELSQSYKKDINMESLVSNNVLSFLDKSKRNNPFKPRKQKTTKKIEVVKDIVALRYEPWQNQQQESDFFVS